jgi:hypothetical protein
VDKVLGNALTCLTIITYSKIPLLYTLLSKPPPSELWLRPFLRPLPPILSLVTLAYILTRESIKSSKKYIYIIPNLIILSNIPYQGGINKRPIPPKTLVISILKSFPYFIPLVHIAQSVIKNMKTEHERTLSTSTSTPYYLSCKGHSIKGLYTP